MGPGQESPGCRSQTKVLPEADLRLRDFIRTQLCDGAYPQLLLRLGTAIQTAVSIRRPPGAVLFVAFGGPFDPADAAPPDA